MSSLTAICIAGWALTLPIARFMVRYTYLAHLAIDRGAKIEAQILLLKGLGVFIFGLCLVALMYSLREQIPELVWPATYGVIVVGLTIALQLRARYRLRTE